MRLRLLATVAVAASVALAACSDDGGRASSSADDAVEAGFLLEADRDAVVAEAESAPVPN